jgi:hypothetical protein
LVVIKDAAIKAFMKENDIHLVPAAWDHRRTWMRLHKPQDELLAIEHRSVDQ